MSILRHLCLAVLLLLSGHAAADRAPAGDALDAATVFCHAGQDGDHGTPVLPHHAQEAATLLAGLAAHDHAALPAAPPSVPRRIALRIAQPGVAHARAPPTRPVAFAYARGPPPPV